MAKQSGTIRIQGTVDGLTYYKRLGKEVVRVSNGHSKEKIASDPAFENLRKNNKIFGASSAFAAVFRNSLYKEIANYTDKNTTFSSTMQAFSRALKSHVAQTKTQIFSLSNHPSLFHNLSWNNTNNAIKLLSWKYNNELPYEIRINIPGSAYDPYLMKKASLSHVEVKITMFYYSDVNYEVASGEATILNHDAHMVCRVVGFSVYPLYPEARERKYTLATDLIQTKPVNCTAFFLISSVFCSKEGAVLFPFMASKSTEVIAIW